MERPRGQGEDKPYRGAIRKLVTTGSVTAPDQDFSDALFLVNNPSWTYRDLQETPALIVGLIKAIQSGREKVAAARAAKD